MCGICGRIAFDDQTEGFGLVQKMMDLLAHRGPDDSGIWKDSHAVLGHRRLSIIDLSEHGKQPMISEDGKKALIFNGEIYNFLQLKQQFSSELAFRYQNDSEVLLKLYEKFGSEMLQHLRGMFAFAIWDGDKQELFFARDRIGKKPFYYSIQGSKMIFASELRALLLDSTLKVDVDPQSIYRFLNLQYIPSPHTIFRQVRKLPPGHYGIFSRSGLRLQRYWKLEHQPQDWNEEEATDRLAALLKEAVDLRLISDVPLGAFLSGGIDSSAVVAVMSELLPSPVKTFTIRFEEEPFDESAFARSVSNHFQTQHHEFLVKPDHTAILEKLVLHYSEPFADPSAIPSFYLAEMTRGHVTVALNGDGGDECFGGYPRYRLAPRRKKGASLIQPILHSLPENMRFISRLSDSLGEHLLDLAPLYLRRIRFFSEKEARQLFTPAFAETIGAISILGWLEEHLKPYEQLPVAEALMAVDAETYLPDDLLVKVDVACMASSLETRSPFLDHRMMEFAASLPVHLKIRKGVSKYILRKTMEKRLPQTILKRPKMGFGVPLSNWFRKELREYVQDLLLSRRAIERGYFQQKRIEALLQRHFSGIYDNAYKVYALLILELWHRQFIDRPPQ